MNLLSIIAIAFGLAMDAFAVAIASSISLRGASARQTFRMAFHFGLFQAFMPVVGWLAGLTVERWVAGWDHWVAFGLLVIIGGRMLYASLADRGKEGPKDDPTRGTTLILLATAISIDALAVGLSFAMLEIDIWYPCVIIGLVAAAMTVAGMRLGARLGRRFGRGAEAIGGIVLIGIGIRILVEHLF